MNVGDNPPTMRQLCYLGNILRRAGVDLIEAQRLVDRCSTRRMASQEIIKALRLKKESDQKKHDEMRKNVESIRVSNSRQNEKK